MRRPPQECAARSPTPRYASVSTIRAPYHRPRYRRIEPGAHEAPRDAHGAAPVELARQLGEPERARVESRGADPDASSLSCRGDFDAKGFYEHSRHRRGGLHRLAHGEAPPRRRPPGRRRRRPLLRAGASGCRRGRASSRPTSPRRTWSRSCARSGSTSSRTTPPRSTCATASRIPSATRAPTSSAASSSSRRAAGRASAGSSSPRPAARSTASPRAGSPRSSRIRPTRSRPTAAPSSRSRSTSTTTARSTASRPRSSATPTSTAPGRTAPARPAWSRSSPRRSSGGKTPKIRGDGEQTRDYVYVDDLVRRRGARRRAGRQRHLEPGHRRRDLGQPALRAPGEGARLQGRGRARGPAPAGEQRAAS